jgi:signal transduction histidine kinase
MAGERACARCGVGLCRQRAEKGVAVRNLSIRWRLVGGFLAIVGLIAAAAGVALRGLGEASRHHEEALDACTGRAVVGAELKAALLDEVRAQKNYLLRQEAQDLAEVARHREEVHSLRAALETGALTPTERARLVKLDAALDQLDVAFQEHIAVREALGVAAADQVMRGRAAAVVAVLDEVVAAGREQAAEGRKQALDALRRIRVVTGVLIGVIGLLAAGVGLGLSLSITRPLKRLQSQIDALARRGTMPTGPAEEGRNEIAEIARAFHELVEKASLIRELESRSRRLAELSTRTSRDQEEERARIARGLHDGFGQTLTAIKLHLTAAGRETGGAEAVGERLAKARALIDGSLDEVRRLVFQLRPPALDNLGLRAALEAYGRDFASRTGIEVTVEAEKFEPRLPFETETALYRICQEALTNTSKHAHAKTAWVRVAGEGDRVVLVAGDDGDGFDAGRVMEGEDTSAGVGLLSMERRAEGLGGTFEIESRQGEGTTIRVSVPRGHEMES